MATAKKTGFVDKMKNAIGEMFAPAPTPAKKAPKPAVKKPVVKKAAAKKAPAKKAPAGKASVKKASAPKTATKKGVAQDRKLIALSQPYEVRDWCKSLGCTEAELTAAVKEVGHSAAKVRAYLKAR